ncbi:MAG: hypothetical protein ACI8PZ_000394 [Myxococcota bacterium]|jgi:hypothetical protein
MTPLLFVLFACSPTSGGPDGDTAAATTSSGNTPAGSTPSGSTSSGSTPAGTTATETGDTAGLGDDPPETVPELRDVFSHRSGVYDAPFDLSLTPAFDGATVVCSLDGSAPDPAGPPCVELQIDHTVVVRATVVGPGGVAAIGPLTRTFVLPETVGTQAAPPDWPSEWWGYHEFGPYVADYGMDREIVDAPVVDLPAALRFLPTLSLVVDPDDLFGPDGIHENPEEHGVEFERPATVELFTADGAESVAVDCGVRIHGGAGRRPDRSPKKSFRLVFKSEYGPTEFVHPLYPDEPVDRFNTLVLRAGYNRVWNNWQSGQRNRSQYMRERFAGDLLRDMGHLVSRARYVHLYLDGLYWGIYLVQERPDAAMQAEHLGGAREDYDALNSGEVVDGDSEGWDRLFALAAEDLTDDDHYAEVLTLLDRDLYIEYMLLNFALGNADWPIKNYWAGRNRLEDGPFRFFSWDTELIFRDDDDNLIDEAPEGSPGWLFQQLRQNPEFVVRFGDLAHRHMLADGGQLTAEAQVARWRSLSLEVLPALHAASARWGDHWRDDRADPEGDLYTVDDHWVPEFVRLTDGFIQDRHSVFMDQLRDGGLYPSLAAPAPDLPPGMVPVGAEVLFSAEAPVWHTTDGSDPRQPGGAVSPSAVSGPLVVDAEVSVLARARVDDGTWSALVEATWAPE